MTNTLKGVYREMRKPKPFSLQQQGGKFHPVNWTVKHPTSCLFCTLILS